MSGRHTRVCRFNHFFDIQKSDIPSKGEYPTITELSQYKKTKHTKYPHQVERLRKLGVLKQQQASKGALLSFKELVKMSPHAI
jgi:hypothetical protein